MIALLPVTAAVSTDTTRTPEAPVAITQPVGYFGTLLGYVPASPVLPESGLIMLVGTALLGLGSVVRRSTRV